MPQTWFRRARFRRLSARRAGATAGKVLTAAIPRLGVQQYTYWSEGQHGVNRLGADTAAVGQGELDAQATSFPVNFASTRRCCTWCCPT